MIRLRCFFLCAIGLSTLTGCDGPAETQKISLPADTNQHRQSEPHEPNTTLLSFSLALDQRVYDRSDYSEPPQFAIWLEDDVSGNIRTVWVTYRMGSGDWKGKLHCHTALPYWVGRYNKEAGTSGPPTFYQPVPDAISGATPQQVFVVNAEVPIGSGWKYFVEVNVAGDYNADFPSMINGVPDPQGNGQPSLIYQGQIEAVNGSHDVPQLIGRTKQWYPIDDIIADLQGITTAKDLFSEIRASCKAAAQTELKN